MSTLMILLLIGCISMSLGTGGPNWSHLRIHNRKTKETVACVAFQKKNNAKSFTVEDAKDHCNSLNQKKCKDMELLDDPKKATIFANIFIYVSKRYPALQYTDRFLTGIKSAQCENCVFKKIGDRFFVKTPQGKLDKQVGIICAKKKQNQ
ncbi:uncharacterized protein [Argopecten irradians]|uniref:uncharacterized protein n=1 Tax=Argopecten irradians TaxID=31199 RepID=UPI0037105460